MVQNSSTLKPSYLACSMFQGSENDLGKQRAAALGGCHSSHEHYSAKLKILMGQESLRPTKQRARRPSIFHP
jgi:hypothetical protein